jgi:C7-cyclitol 7-kinase
MLEHCLVFDLGGTTMRAGLYDPSQDLLSRVERRATPNGAAATASPERIYARVFKELEDLGRRVFPNARPPVVSLAFPGPIDAAGNALAAPTVFGARLRAGLPLRNDLTRRWPDARVIVLNDLTAAGYRYLRNAREDFCVVTVSSGIGHKLFVDGRPLVGRGGRGGEIGHLRVDFSADAPICDCGAPGHLAAVASARGVLARARRQALRDPGLFRRSLLADASAADPEALDTRALVAAYHAGDDWTLALIRDAARPLGQALAGLHLGVGVERFVVIGGFALALGERYRRELVDAMAESAWNLDTDWNAMLELGINDDDAGLLGAGRCAALLG